MWTVLMGLLHQIQNTVMEQRWPTIAVRYRQVAMDDRRAFEAIAKHLGSLSPWPTELDACVHPIGGSPRAARASELKLDGRWMHDLDWLRAWSNLSFLHLAELYGRYQSLVSRYGGGEP